MANKSAANFVLDGVKFASKEEVEFQHFIAQASGLGLVYGARYQPDSFTLVPSATREVIKRFKRKPDRVEQRSLFRSHVYTPDWEFVVTPKFLKWFPKHGLLLQPLEEDVVLPTDYAAGPARCIVDIKGAWNLHGGDRIFPIHQKLMWSVHRRLVNKLMPEAFFRRIGAVPDNVRYMQNRKTKVPKKAYIRTPSLSQLDEKAAQNTSKFQ